MATERTFAPGFELEVPGILTYRDVKASTPEQALAGLLRSTQAYLAPEGTVVRVFRIVDEGDQAATEHYGERVEQQSLVSPETVYRRIFTTMLNAVIDFRQELAADEQPPGYDELLAEVKQRDPHVTAVTLRSVAMTGGVHICDEECRWFGKRDHFSSAESDR
jgi:hypothetical protein